MIIMGGPLVCGHVVSRAVTLFIPEMDGAWQARQASDWFVVFSSRGLGGGMGRGGVCAGGQACDQGGGGGGGATGCSSSHCRVRDARQIRMKSRDTPLALTAVNRAIKSRTTDGRAVRAR